MELSLCPSVWCTVLRKSVNAMVLFAFWWAANFTYYLNLHIPFCSCYWCWIFLNWHSASCQLHSFCSMKQATGLKRNFRECHVVYSSHWLKCSQFLASTFSGDNGIRQTGIIGFLQTASLKQNCRYNWCKKLMSKQKWLVRNQWLWIRCW
jgi:hypothetical protein